MVSLPPGMRQPLLVDPGQDREEEYTLSDYKIHKKKNNSIESFYNIIDYNVNDCIEVIDCKRNGARRGPQS